MRLRSFDKHHMRKSADRKAQIRKGFDPLTGMICAFRSADFLRWFLFPERKLMQNLFSISKIFRNTSLKSSLKVALLLQSPPNKLSFQGC